MASPIGHNNPPNMDADGIVEFPHDMPKMHFFQCDIAALRKAIIDKPLDVRGAYISALLAMYEYMEPLPADDKKAQARLGITDARVYKRMKRTFIEHGWLHERPSGALSNARFEAEITAYVVEFRNRSEAGKKREEKARVERATEHAKQLAKPELTPSYGLAKPQLEASYGLAKPQLMPQKNKNPNEINEAGTSNEVAVSPHIRDRDRDRDKEKENTNCPSESIAARDAVGPNEIAGLNGATALIVTTFAKLLNHAAPDYRTARVQIQQATTIYGDRAVRDGFAEFQADIADGRVKVPSIKQLYGYFRTAKDRAGLVDRSNADRKRKSLMTRF